MKTETQAKQGKVLVLNVSEDFFPPGSDNDPRLSFVTKGHILAIKAIDANVERILGLNLQDRELEHIEALKPAGVKIQKPRQQNHLRTSLNYYLRGPVQRTRANPTRDFIRKHYADVSHLSREKAATYIHEKAVESKIRVKQSTIKAYLSVIRHDTGELHPAGPAAETSEDLIHSAEGLLVILKEATEQGVQIVRLVNSLVAQNDSLKAIRTLYENQRAEVQLLKEQLMAANADVAEMKRTLGDLGKRLLAKSGEKGAQQ